MATFSFADTVTIVKVLFDDVFSVFEQHIDFVCHICAVVRFVCRFVQKTKLLLLTILSASKRSVIPQQVLIYGTDG